MLGLPAHHNLLFAIFLLARAVLTLNVSVLCQALDKEL